MTHVKLIKLKIKPGKKAAWLHWADELQRRRDEVLETLRNEHVVSEACFLSEDGEHVYYYMEAESMDKAKTAAQHSAYPIDAEHRTVREKTLEAVTRLNCLFHFENRSKSDAVVDGD